MIKAAEFVERATQNLFFTGKGGVGKTSLACATAVHLADRGRRVLLVSTDPASNLDEVLGLKLGLVPTPVPDVPGLFALNLDPEQAAREYRERVVGPYRGVFPDSVIAGMEEQLSGSCTVEIAAFDEFSRLLADPSTTSRFDHVVFDTAPTGHTLRLLALPAAWNSYLDQNTSGMSCLGPLSGLGEQRLLYEKTVRALTDSIATTLVLVTRAERSALAEAARTSAELAALGVQNQHLMVNAVFEALDRDDAVAAAWEHRDAAALAELPGSLAPLPRSQWPLVAHNLIGVETLRAMFQPASSADSPSIHRAEPDDDLPLPLLELIDQIASSRRGVVLTMGKGGVGKTTVAAAVAVELARRGLPVHLTTTDPAAHIQNTVGAPPANLTISRIDPQVETAAYRAEVLATAGADLDADGRAVLEEDLNSPCTEEVAVFRAFARAVDHGENRFVVLDTAPTGHTILLLDAALAYHRELSRQSNDLPQSVRELLPRLRDDAFTKILLVTLPEATPVHEASRLEQDLLRADIRTFAWVINQSLSPWTLRDPVLLARRWHEREFVREVCRMPSRRVALVPWQTTPPAGTEGLLRVVQGRSDSVGSEGARRSARPPLKPEQQLSPIRVSRRLD